MYIRGGHQARLFLDHAPIQQTEPHIKKIVGLLRAVKRDWHRRQGQQGQQQQQETQTQTQPASRGEEKDEAQQAAVLGEGQQGQQGQRPRAGSLLVLGPPSAMAYHRLEDAERRLLRLTK